MAKRPELKITQRTAPAESEQGSVPATGRTVATGVGLKESEIAELDRIAAETEIARNALLRIAVRRFLEDHRAGRVNLAQYVEVTTKKRLKLP